VAPSEDVAARATTYFKSQHDWLQEDGDIPYELIEGVVEASAWWFTNNGPLESPGDARNIELGPLGYRVYTSRGNSFEITCFVVMARIVLARVVNLLAANDRDFDPEDIRDLIARHAHYCVSKYDDSLYPHYGEAGWLPFGNHSISTHSAAEYLIQASGLYKVISRFRQMVR